MQKTKSGFTIVELLIVIVVIGILAAITIVAFNGLQERGRKAALQSLLTQTEREIMTHALQKNGETVSISGSLIGYQVGVGESNLSKSLAGASDITMYAVYETANTDGSYAQIARLGQESDTNRFKLQSSAPGSTAMGYRIDTAAPQSNITAYQSAARVSGSKGIGWIQASNNATSISFAYSKADVHGVASITPHSNWNFTTVTLPSSNGITGQAALVFNTIHDTSTRTQIMRWLAEKYSVSLSL